MVGDLYILILWISKIIVHETIVSAGGGLGKFKIIDLFCGTGGFSKGFEATGKCEVVLGLDNLPIAIETFKLNHSKAHAVCGDIRKVSPKSAAELVNLKKGQVDLIIGSPPCQGFSSIRPHRSTNDDDPRNNLLYQFSEYVKFFKPKAVVMENVVGLATHKAGETIFEIEREFETIGYDSDWKILNAAHFGVPQRRERLILIAVERGGLIKFPIPEYFCDGNTIGYKRKERMLLPEESNLFNSGRKLKKAITVLDAINDLPTVHSGGVATKYTRKPKNEYQMDRRKEFKDLKLHYSTAHSEKMMEVIRHSGPNINCIPKHLISSGFSSCYSRLDGDAPSVTITVNFVHPASNRCIHPKLDRALTPREGARLQSFDDDFEFAGNRSQIVKQIGNAVPPLLGQKIAEAIHLGL